MSAASVEERLEDLERPHAGAIEVSDVGPLTRLYTTPWVHRAVPGPVAVRLAALLGGLRWYLAAARRQEAIGWAEVVLGPAARPSRARSISRRALAEDWAKRECFWRDWDRDAVAVEGLDRLSAIRAAGRGAVVAYPHVGPHTTLLYELAAHGFNPYLPRLRRPQDEGTLRGYNGRRRRALLQRIEDAGGRWVGRGDSYPVLREALIRGGVCVIAFDAPGSTPSRILGQEVQLASGPATLAHDAGVPLIPAFALRHGGRQHVTLLEPIEPGSAPGPEALHHSLVAALDPVMTENLAQIYPFKPPLPRFLQQRKRPKAGKRKEKP